MTDAHLEPRDGDGGALRFRIEGASFDAVILPRDIMEAIENQRMVLASLDPELSAANLIACESDLSSVGVIATSAAKRVVDRSYL